MRYGVLGPLEVWDGSRMVPLAQGRQRLLLAVLLVHANETLDSDRLIDALWGEAPPASAASSLHNLVSGLRKGLGDGRLVTSGHGYALRVADGELDLQRFEALLTAGRAALMGADPGRAAVLLREALELWRGPPLGELAYHAALAGEAARLEEARLAALEERIEADLACGRHAELVAELEALTREHPLSERLRAQQMLALYRAGRQADALAAYRDARARLVEELGVEPGPALRRLEQAVLEHDPALGAPDALPDAPPALAWARRHAGALLGTGVILLAAALVLLIVVGGNEPSRTAAVAPTSDVLAAIDPATNRISRRFPVGDTPTVVAVGADAAWTVNADGATISRVDLRTRAVETLSTGIVPLDIAADRDDAWLVGGHPPRAGKLEGTPNDTLARLDPVSGAPVASLPLPASVGPGFGGPPQSVAVGGGAVWAIGRSGWLVRVDARSRHSRILRSFSAQRVATGDGQVWVLAGTPANEPRAANLLRLDPRSGRVEARVKVPSDSLRGIAVGAGAVWVADDFAGGVWRFDRRGGSRPRIIAIDQGVDGVTVADGAVWTANSLAGTVARIDPATNRVVAKFGLGGAPRGIAIGAGRVWVTLAGVGRNVAVAGSLSPDARVEAVGSADCGPVLSGPGGDPDLLIVSDEPLAGSLKAAAASASAAVAFVLRDRGFRAGRFGLGMQSCNDALAQTGGPDELKCRANARAYASNVSVIGIVGPVHSFCTAAMLPVLNQAPGGPVSVVSTQNTEVNLVRRDPNEPADRLDELYPTGQRGYARVIPSDDYVSAAGALFAQRLSPGGVFYIENGFDDRSAIYFRTAARRIGLPILDAVRRRKGQNGERRLAQRIRASGARAVYINGDFNTNIRRLRAALDPDVALVFSQGTYPVSRLFDSLGRAARGVYMTVPGTSLDRLGPAGQRFLRDFGSTRPGGQVPAFAVYAATATEVLLDAIARSDGTRESVSQALGTVRLPESPLGPITLDRHGELTRNPIPVVRADHGGEPFDPGDTDGGIVVDVITPPARLVTK